MKSINEIIVDVVRERLKLCNNNQSKAAKSLGMSRGCFRKYMKLGKDVTINYSVEL